MNLVAKLVNFSMKVFSTKDSSRRRWGDNIKIKLTTKVAVDQQGLEKGKKIFHSEIILFMSLTLKNKQINK